MEQLNKVELIGVVGSVRIDNVNGTPSATFAIATSLSYKDNDGNALVETTWHTCVAFLGKAVKKEDIYDLERGDKVHVFGRLRVFRVTEHSGADRLVTKVVVNSLERILDVNPLQVEDLNRK